jgi:tight adherence protein C
MSGLAGTAGACAAALALLAGCPPLDVLRRSAPSAPTLSGTGRPHAGQRSPAAVRRAIAALVAPVPRPRPLGLAGLGLATAVLGVLAPPLGSAPVVIWIGRGHLRTRRGRRVEEQAVTRGLPDVVDLLLLCAGAGLSLPLSHRVVADRAPPPVGAALGAAADASDGGRVRADALVEALAPLGDRAAALGHVLIDHLRYGVPLAPALERLGLELRLDRRRRAEEEARRVPVRLLAPLLLCVLPAFGLLSVVPLLVASLRNLPR